MKRLLLLLLLLVRAAGLLLFSSLARDWSFVCFEEGAESKLAQMQIYLLSSSTMLFCEMHLL